jgi:hypothetical protein
MAVTITGGEMTSDLTAYTPQFRPHATALGAGGRGDSPPARSFRGDLGISG